jgi:hypothetical protein
MVAGKGGTQTTGGAGMLVQQLGAPKQCASGKGGRRLEAAEAEKCAGRSSLKHDPSAESHSSFPRRSGWITASKYYAYSTFG